MSLSNTYIELQKLLVKPQERISFILKFTFIWSISDLILVYFCYLATSLIYNKNNLNSSYLGGFILGIIIGLLFGVANGLLQWLVLRKYLIREWIIAIAVRSTFYSIYVIAIFLWQTKIYDYPISNNIPLIWLFVSNLLFILLSLSFSLAQGWLQMLVFKTYINNINWWLYFPLIISFILGLQYIIIAFILWLFFKKYLKKVKWIFCFLLTVKLIAFILNSLITFSNLLTFNNQILWNLRDLIYQLNFWLVYGNLDGDDGLWFNLIINIILFATIQAFAICYLERKNPNRFLSIDSNSLFASSTDTKNYYKTKAIAKRTYNKISNIWQGNFDCSFRLTYWIVTEFDGSIIACYPLDRVSEENFQLTPLAQLVDSLSSHKTNNQKATAKLQLVFDPPGSLKITSLSGISLNEIIIATFIIIIAISFILRAILLFL